MTNKPVLVDGKLYVAPNGTTTVKIYPHGAIEFVGKVSKKHQRLVEEMSSVAASMLPENASPFKVFELMGWREKHDR